MLAIAARWEIRDEFGPFPNESYSLSTVRPESDTLPEYLQEALPNQTDSGNRRRGQKEHLDCRQFDYTCGFVAKSFSASVDVTGAV